MAASAQLATLAPDLRFDQAEFVVSNDEVPPQSGWRPQALPDSWLHNHPGLAGIGWYRMRFKLDAMPPQAMALFVSRVAVTGQFWLNGSVLNPEARFTPPGGLIGSQMTNQSYLITLPTGLFRVGDNVLYIRVQGYAVGGDGLSVVRIGSIERLRVPWLVREIPQRIIPQALIVLLACASVFGLALWWRTRRAGDLHFTAAMALWAGLLSVYLFPDLPLTRNGLVIILTLLLITLYWALLSLFYRYCNTPWLWYPRLLNISSALMVLATLVIVLLKGTSVHLSQYLALVLAPTVILRVLSTVMLVQWAWRERLLRVFALMAAELLWFGGSLQLIAILAGWLPHEPFWIEQAGSLPLFLVLLFFFIERVVRDREQAAREQQAAIGAERARILQDMHDGMGSQLITALRMAQREDGDRAVVAQSIEEALQDLRLIIDSLDVADQDLLSLLGNLRYRLTPRLAALGIRLDWEAPSLTELAGLTPRSALGVLRIVQEALNNAVKHARPTVITVSTARRDGGAVIGVADNGIGFDPDATGGAGRGLSSMRKRAQQLGATVLVERRDGGGTCVSLLLPPAVGRRPQIADGMSANAPQNG
ncbi:MAG: ATP-binding protein [Thiobacillus sp.]